MALKSARVVKHPDCNHDFPDPQRREAYEIIDSVLRPESGAR